ncbi:MAG TPA: hypothetical protein VK210_13210 [Terriglobia bacterium]|nr:hypothetical protein [Terriglobia bacterium]
MSETSSSDKTPGLPPLDKIYSEVRAGIRETDNISFKLLGLVPLVSGTAIIALVLQNQGLSAPLVTVLSLFAGGITLGLFRWELRNIQTCSWLIKYADALEKQALAAQSPQDIYRPRPEPPQGIGKTEAEKLIYTATILAWLAVPPAIGSVHRLPPGIAFVYYILAIAILIGAFISVKADARIPSSTHAGDKRH